MKNFHLASSVPDQDVSGVAQLRRRAEEYLGLPKTLYDFQWEGVSFLYRSRCALLADEMGLGKTVQASVALALLMAGHRAIGRALIVAPSSLTTNWMLELATWAPSLTVRRVRGSAREREAFYLLPIPVLVSSYEQIRRDGLDRIPAGCFDIVVLDEAQRIKSPHSATALACRLLPRKCAWALSATPLENRLEDVVSVLRFLNPALPSELGRRDVAGHLELMMLRRRKRDVRRELPPVILQDVRLDLTAPQRLRYDDLWVNRHTEVRRPSRRAPTAVLLSLVTKLKIVCNHDITADASSKLKAMLEVIDGAGAGARVLVFSQFVRTLRWIADRLPVPHGLITGAMADHERQAAIQEFARLPSPRVLLVSLRAGGVGLNLGEATHVVVFDRWWNPAVEMQAVYRAHRFRREEPLHVFRFLVVDSIEERIAEILDRKENLFQGVVDGPDTLSQGFTANELLQILQLSASATQAATPQEQEV